MLGWLQLFLGPFLGTLLGYYASVRLETRRSRKRRQTLLALAFEELEALPSEFPENELSTRFDLLPVEVPALDRLLDGEHIPFNAPYATVIRLTKARAAVRRFNAHLAATTTLQAAGSPQRHEAYVALRESWAHARTIIDELKPMLLSGTHDLAVTETRAWP